MGVPDIDPSNPLYTVGVWVALFAALAGSIGGAVNMVLVRQNRRKGAAEADKAVADAGKATADADKATADAATTIVQAATAIVAPLLESQRRSDESNERLRSEVASQGRAIATLTERLTTLGNVIVTMDHMAHTHTAWDVRVEGILDEQGIPYPPRPALWGPQALTLHDDDCAAHTAAMRGSPRQ